MMRYGFSGTWSAFNTSGGGAAAAGRLAPPPPHATSSRKATLRRTFMISPPPLALPRGPIARGVVRWRTTREPIAKVVCLSGQLPFLEDRQRHRAHAALAGTGGEALLLQPGLELVRLRVGRDCALQQVELDRQPDGVRSGVALAALAPPLRRVEGGEQLATDLARAGRRPAHASRPPPRPGVKPSRLRRRSVIRTSSACPGRSGRWDPPSRAATSGWTVIRSSSRIAQGAAARTVVTPFRYPLHVLQTSIFRSCSPSSGARRSEEH